MTTLRTHTLRWPIIGMLGVSIVVAGQFSGWNFGLQFGWANFAIAAAIMFLFYLSFCQLLSEMGATWPSAGGLARFCGLAFGDYAGGLVSVSIGMAMIAASGIVSTFIAGYATSTFGIDGMTVRIALFSGILLVLLLGTKETMWFLLLTGSIAVATLVTFTFVAAPHITVANFALETGTISAKGVISAIPYALWMYLALEQAVCASEEADVPARDVPRGLAMGLIVLTCTGLGVLISASGAGGVAAISEAADPLLAALSANGIASKFIVGLIGTGAVLGLLASFFSINYSASRQIFDLARGRFLPAPFRRLSRGGVPYVAIVAVITIGFLLSLVSPEQLLLIIVLMFTATYLLTALAYVALRRSHAVVPRAYGAVGGRVTGFVTLILSTLIFYACFALDAITVAIVAATFAVILMHRYLARTRAHTATT